MSGRPASSRGAFPWHRASFSALCIVLFVATIALAASVPDSARWAFANQSATPGTAATPSVLGTPSALASPSAQATPSALATPSAERPSDWSNGAVPIWTYETGTDYWAGRFPPDRGSGVFGFYTYGSDFFRVFDAETFEQLWTWDKGSTAYSWRPTGSAFLIAQGNQLTARNPRTGSVMWRHWVRDEEWDFTTYDGVGGDASQRFAYITSDRHFTMLDLASGATLLEARRRGDNIDWETRDGVMLLENGNQLSMIDLDAGNVLWSYTGSGSDISWRKVDDDWYVTSGSTLAVIDPVTGQERWSFAGSGSPISWTMEEDALYVISGKDVSAIVPDDGTEQWRFTGNDDVTRVWIADDAVFARTDSAVSAIDPRSGVERWRFTAANGDMVLAATEDMFYIYSGVDLSAIDPVSGAEVWRYKASDPLSTVTLTDGMLFARTDRAVSGIDPESGGELWRYQVTGTDIEDWLLDEDEADLYVKADSSLVLLDATTGIEQWHVVANAEIIWNRYEGCCTFLTETMLYSIDPETGDELWRSDTLAGASYYRLEEESGTYYVDADVGVLIDAQTGETLVRGAWERRDRIIYARLNDQVTAFDTDAREELWRFTSDSIVSRFYLQDDVVLVVTRNLLVALDRTTGIELWTFMAEAPIESLDRTEHVIRLTDSYGTLYALAPKAIQLEAGGTAVTTEEITLRGAPNPGSVERATIPPGTAVTITGDSDEHDGMTWWPVTTGELGEQGWVTADALEPTANAPSTPSTPAA